MERDITQQATGKLQGGWSASDFSKTLNKGNFLEMLLPKFDKLDPLVRVRLLLSLLTLDEGVKQSLPQDLEVPHPHDSHFVLNALSGHQSGRHTIHSHFMAS